MNKKINVWFTVGFLVLLFILIAVIITAAFIKFKDDQERKQSLNHLPSIVAGKDKPNIIVFGDYKCPYCKKYEQNVYPTIKKQYIQNSKVNYYFVNAQLLGEDTKKASVIAHALFKYEPSKYWEFHKNMFDRQPNNESNWITEKVINEELDKLSLPNKVRKQINNEYNNKNSHSWKLAHKDEKLLDTYKVKQVPTIYVNNKRVNDPYNKDEIRKKINKEL